MELKCNKSIVVNSGAVPHHNGSIGNVDAKLLVDSSDGILNRIRKVIEIRFNLPQLLLFRLSSQQHSTLRMRDRIPHQFNELLDKVSVLGTGAINGQNQVIVTN